MPLALLCRDGAGTGAGRDLGRGHISVADGFGSAAFVLGSLDCELSSELVAFLGSELRGPERDAPTGGARYPETDEAGTDKECRDGDDASHDEPSRADNKGSPQDVHVNVLRVLHENVDREPDCGGNEQQSKQRHDSTIPTARLSNTPSRCAACFEARSEWMVPGEGLEPSRPEGPAGLSRLRLPITPPGRVPQR
jgi:hypothetical protein